MTHDFGSSTERVVRGEIRYFSGPPEVIFTFSVSDDNVNFVPYGGPYVAVGSGTQDPTTLPVATFRYLKMTTE